MQDTPSLDSLPASPVPAVGARWPILGLCSFLGLPLGALAGYAAALAANSAATGVAGTAGVAIGVLASAVTGMMATVGSRVRGERWAWLGIVGALVSAAPLALFIVAMMFHR